MAVRVKPVNTAGANWTESASGASTRYAAEAVQASTAWAQNAQAAAPNFKQAISAAGIEARFSAGIQRAGAGKYARKVEELGASRYTTGVSSGRGDYEAGVTPYLQTIQGLTLPGRKPRGDPGNIQRVAVIADALHKRRIGQAAAGR